jgi:nitric oxide reductase subunit B
MQNLRWFRSIGDTVFAIGALMLAWFLIGLVTGRSYDVASEAEPKGLPEY